MSARRRPWMMGALLLGACSKPQAPVAEAPVATPVAPPESPAAITHEGRGLRGVAVVGKDGYGITRCGEKTQQIMQMTPEAKPFLDKFLAGGAHQFFVEAEGRDLDSGHVMVTRFHRLYSKGPGCEAKLDPSAFVAFGINPVWAASDSGGALRLESVGTDAMVATDSDAHSEKGEWIVEGQTPKGLLTVRLVPGECHDGESDALYAWTATAHFGDKELKGCGFPGFEPRK
jgi:uncharacterized membrane protein